MDQRVTMIMTGARDIAKLRTFYERGLGWNPRGPVSPNSVMYKVGHSILVFLDAAYLGKERGEPPSQGTKSSLAVFVGSREKVDETYNRAVAAGATITSNIKDRDGGIYSGYFADPEGNSWEIVWAANVPLDENGSLNFPA